MSSFPDQHPVDEANWNQLGQFPWRAISFGPGNNWANYRDAVPDVTATRCEFFKDPMGVVRLKGVARAAGAYVYGAGTSVIGTMPDDAAPNKIRAFMVPTFVPALAGFWPTILVIYHRTHATLASQIQLSTLANGAPGGPNAAGDYVYLDGISYRNNEDE